jgi:exopolysaccharide biosynthesis polyprenyl glycosylphosphotransferase
MQNSTTEKSKLDLRASVFPKLRRNVYGAGLRISTLVLGDLSFLSLAWVIGGTYGTPLDSFWTNNPKSLVLILAVELTLIAAQGLYKSGEKRCDYWSLIKAITFAQIVLLLIGFLFDPNSGFVSRSTYLLAWGLSIVFVCANRLTIDLLLKELRKKGAIRYNTLLICPEEDSEKASRVLEKENCYKSIKIVEDSLIEKSMVKVLIEAIRFLGVAEVFITSGSRVKDQMFLYWSLRNAGIVLRILPIDVEPFYRKSEILMLGGIPTIKFSPPLIAGFDFWLKRGLDFLISALLIVLLSPILLAIAIIIKLDSPGPIFYKQERAGLHSGRFKALKFRTMFINADKLQKELEARNEMTDGVLFKMKDDPRITKVGKFLRRSSLDELPQLFNVVLGEMSIVGPRPLPIRDVENFSEHHFIRHEVLPGITGLWQVSGRSNITSFEEVVRLDTFYIENWSLWLDLKILAQTVIVLLQKKGAY